MNERGGLALVAAIQAGVASLPVSSALGELIRALLVAMSVYAALCALQPDLGAGPAPSDEEPDDA